MEDRFLNHVAKTDECWNWAGYCTPQGYGQFKLDGKAQAAHRVAYALWVGELEPATVVHHRCANRRCVRPDHLQATSHHANLAEMMKRTEYEARIAELENEVEKLRKRAALIRRVKGLFGYGK